MGTYFDTLKELQTKVLDRAFLPVKKFKGLMFAPNKYMRTDGLPVDKSIDNLTQRINETKDPEQKRNLSALLERMESVFDLTEKLYATFNRNPNTFSNWFPDLRQAQEKALQLGYDFFKIPETQCFTLPIELSQFMRIEYQNTNSESRQMFNRILLDNLKLEKDKHYFIKCGVFSSKFEFRNCHLIPSEQNEIGEYFQVINNHAMLVGAGLSNDVVVREYIDDPEQRPTIYNGMPLRTEFRCFVDLDTKDVIQVVPYWNPLVMKHVLQSQGRTNPNIQKYYETYRDFENVLMDDYNKHVGVVSRQIQYIINNMKLHGRWSLDVMKSGNVFYLIDMAEMKSSALTELINPERLKELNIKLQ